MTGVIVKERMLRDYRLSFALISVLVLQYPAGLFCQVMCPGAGVRRAEAPAAADRNCHEHAVTAPATPGAGAMRAPAHACGHASVSLSAWVGEKLQPPGASTATSAVAPQPDFSPNPQCTRSQKTHAPPGPPYAAIFVLRV